MNEQRLQSLMAQGFGRVVPFLQTHDATPYRAVVLHACHHNMALDPQVEGSRAVYMLDVIQATGDVDYYRERIISALASVTDAWDAAQLFNLVRLFASAGNTDARAALYAKFACNDTEERFVGAEDLIALDGVDGFLTVARQIGATIRADPEVWENDYLLNRARERCGAEAVDRVLAASAAIDDDIAAYLRAVYETVGRREEYRATQRATVPLSYEELAAEIRKGGRATALGSLQRWARQADDSSLTQAAADLVQQEEPEHLTAYLRLFGRRAYPLDPAPLLRLAQHADPAVARAALLALCQVTDGRVRELALTILADDRAGGWQKGEALQLLAHNAETGDDRLIVPLLTAWRDADPESRHGLGYGALALLEAHPSPRAAPVLELLYDVGPCSSCRERCVDLLVTIGRLPDRVRRECRFDANLDLRTKAKSSPNERQGDETLTQ